MADRSRIRYYSSRTKFKELIGSLTGPEKRLIASLVGCSRQFIHMVLSCTADSKSEKAQQIIELAIAMISARNAIMDLFNKHGAAFQPSKEQYSITIQAI